MTIREYIKNCNITTEEIEILNRKGGFIARVTPAETAIEKYLDNEIIKAQAIVCHHFVYVGTEYTYGGGMEAVDNYLRYVIRIKTENKKRA